MDLERYFLDRGLLPVAEAATALGITEQRLIGFMARNGIADPIGDGALVYGWSLRTFAGRLADTSTAVQE